MCVAWARTARKLQAQVYKLKAAGSPGKAPLLLRGGRHDGAGEDGARREAEGGLGGNGAEHEEETAASVSRLSLQVRGKKGVSCVAR
eukprot:1766311-Pyramimonas_sp.AAC.1